MEAAVDGEAQESRRMPLTVDRSRAELGDEFGEALAPEPSLDDDVGVPDARSEQHFLSQAERPSHIRNARQDIRR